ncbi:TPA: hypothetical protein ACFP4Y_001412 [Neisseria bacilliformis]|uniref:hypothetical protein n=1 Tax=Neisseria bacilliformis TaxID=267212 RepID=UPI0013648E96|nr:hypothetical protein [Neisseria bacilliformis]
MRTQHRQITRMLGLAPTYLTAAKPKPRAWLAPHTLPKRQRPSEKAKPAFQTASYPSSH